MNKNIFYGVLAQFYEALAFRLSIHVTFTMVVKLAVNLSSIDLS